MQTRCGFKESKERPVNHSTSSSYYPMLDDILIPRPGKGLNIAHLNVRSLLGGHRWDLISNQISSYDLEVFSLSETWLTEAIPSRQVHIQNYSIARLDRSWVNPDNGMPKKGGGSTVLHKKWHKFL